MSKRKSLINGYEGNINAEFGNNSEVFPECIWHSVLCRYYGRGLQENREIELQNTVVVFLKKLSFIMRGRNYICLHPCLYHMHSTLYAIKTYWENIVLRACFYLLDCTLYKATVHN